MSDKPLTWRDRLDKLKRAMGRKPTFEELMEVAQIHRMTPGEIEEQRQSWARGMKPTGDPRFD